MFGMFPKVQRVDFITDTYKENSIKGIERLRRGTSTKILLKGPETTIPSNWHQFLSNDENKTQLIQFILQEWSSNKYHSKLQGRRIFYVCGKDCFFITANDDDDNIQKRLIADLCSSQEEADTRIILHMLNIIKKESDKKIPIIIRSPDTDVLILLIHFCRDKP